MVGAYYCQFCNEPIWDLLHCCAKKYDYEWIKAGYGTMEWSEDTICWRDDIFSLTPSLIKELIWQL